MATVLPPPFQARPVSWERRFRWQGSDTPPDPRVPGTGGKALGVKRRNKGDIGRTERAGLGQLFLRGHGHHLGSVPVCQGGATQHDDQPKDMIHCFPPG